jgi:lambda family phage minor tail protein L
MTIESDIQKANGGAIVEFFELDLNSIAIDEHYYFHNDINELGDNVTWQGQIYTRLPIEAAGFEKNGSGQQPRPTLSIANIDGLVGAIATANDDLIGVKFIRRRTFLKYLDAVNFAAGNPTADANVHFDDEIWFIDRKASSDQVFVNFELASAFDLQGVQLPRRQCIQNVCTWRYRSAECSYAGPAIADKNDAGTTDINVDDCGKRLNSCSIRFPNAALPFGGFPSVGLIR